ncbi:hypothetical protein HDV00_002945 [Rhizophlyctis rosea]|nr:hypothetical protein HDV00_002945 [Rhizophlyctis rosea]
MPLQDDVWDDVWDDDPQMTDTRYDRDVAEREWNKLQDVHGMAGYREGVNEGKEQALQDGFDSGFAEGATVGVEIGRMRGLLSTLIQLYNRPDLPTEQQLTPDQRKRLTDLHDELTTIRVDRFFPLEYFKDSTHKPENAGTLTVPDLQLSTISTCGNMEESGGCCGGGGECGNASNSEQQHARATDECACGASEGACCGGRGSAAETVDKKDCVSADEANLSLQGNDAKDHVARTLAEYRNAVYGLLRELGWDL